MRESTVPSTAQDASASPAAAVAPRERAALVAFVVVSVVATVTWVALLGWLLLAAIRAVGV